MELGRYIDNLRRELSVAAESGGDEGRVLAERLVAQLSSSIQLTLLEVLSDAADEISRELMPGSVEIRLRKLDPTFIVTLPPEEQGYEFEDENDEFESENAMVAPADAAMEASLLHGEGSATARINFRPPEYLKARIEEAAGRERLSVNAWLVRAVSSMLESGDRSHPPRRAQRRDPHQVQRFTGWVK
ncbi:hypothetical protein ABZ371_30345 [Streptomyces sp. NPDC005899]|uniref:hypothetical protein n=1 Tax=Streptomyces sp. NPDC005899 TaxID=3155716 RepID=UPI0033DA9A9E